MYSGLTGSNLMAWLSLSFFTDSLTLTDAHRLWIRPTLLTGGGTLSWHLSFMLYPHTGIPMDQGSRLKRKENLGAVMGHVDGRVRQSLGLSFFKECRKQPIPWASAGFSAHTDWQTKDQPLQIFPNWSNHDLEDRILCPFFCAVNFFIYYALKETSLSNYFIICHTKKYICEWLHYFSS